MTNKKLVVLGFIAAGMLVFAAVQSWLPDRQKNEKVTQSYLLRGLDTAAVASVVVTSGDKQAMLKRSGDDFVAANKDDYPADMRRINDVITRCMDIKTVEHITDSAANHAELGVTEANAASSVRFIDKDGKPIAGLYVSQPRPDKGGVYVRLISSDDVYLSPETPLFSASAIDFIDTELLNVGREKTDSVTITSADGQYTLKLSDSGGIVLENIPEGKKLKDSDARQVFTSLAGLRFEDVKKCSSQTETLDFNITYLCRLKDSTVYTFNIAEKNDKTFVKCTAEFTDKTPVTKDRGVESEEELKAKEAKLLARDDAVKFAEKHADWLYQIPRYKAVYMTKKLSDLLEAEEKKEEQKKPENEQAALLQ